VTAAAAVAAERRETEQPVGAAVIRLEAAVMAGVAVMATPVTAAAAVLERETVEAEVPQAEVGTSRVPRPMRIPPASGRRRAHAKRTGTDLDLDLVAEAREQIAPGAGGRAVAPSPRSRASSTPASRLISEFSNRRQSQSGTRLLNQ
jgi:hypothetical protein